MNIKFGTDGWRGVIGREFTFPNLRRVVQAVCDVMIPAGARHVVVGYDNRFLARRFAEESCAVLLGNGLSVLLGERPHTTPAVSCQVVDAGAAFGLVLTASHNAPEFHGLKIKTAAGASADETVTAAVEQQLDQAPVRRLSPAEGIGLGRLEVRSFTHAHHERLGAVADLPRIRAARLHVVVDSMHGTGERIVEKLLSGSSTRVETLRAGRDPLFGGQSPEPIRTRLGPLLQAVPRQGASLGFATDGDGDRVAAVDDAGNFLSPLRLGAVLALHLIRCRQVPGGLAKTFANTLYLDRIAAAEGRTLHTLPIGFKHIAALLEAGELALGGEESGGIGFAGYLPERDGILAGLLLMEAVAMAGKPLSALVKQLTDEFGDYHYDRVDLQDSQGRLQESLHRLAESPPDRLAGLTVQGVDRLDGTKLLFGERGWLLFRRSGTEPVLRIYAEANSTGLLRRLLQEGIELLGAPGPG
ncbi:MAG: phosphoglucomutase/phosphomannomutase family protein [Acidobacteria bacterium]|nr:MAG: phosphoglucomutase/phosphomannomutase family protein [Acidobacteriota bacterium]